MHDLRVDRRIRETTPVEYVQVEPGISSASECTILQGESDGTTGIASTRDNWDGFRFLTAGLPMVAVPSP